MNIIEILSKGALKKEGLYDYSKSKYIVASIIAGFFIGLGSLTMSLSNFIFADISFPIVKFVNGFVFSLALSLVMVCGAELFTGNVLFFTMGAADGKVNLSKGILICVLSYIGNFIGAVVLSVIFLGADTSSSPVVESVVKLASAKASLPFGQLFFKGILCNIMVCLGILGWNKLSNEAAKLIMVFWVILPFVSLGFEHSVANMTCFVISKIVSSDFTYAMIIHNLIPVTLGNIVGGALVAISYYYVEKRKSS